MRNVHCTHAPNTFAVRPCCHRYLRVTYIYFYSSSWISRHNVHSQTLSTRCSALLQHDFLANLSHGTRAVRRYCLRPDARHDSPDPSFVRRFAKDGALRHRVGKIEGAQALAQPRPKALNRVKVGGPRWNPPDSPGPSRSQIAYTKEIGVFNYYSPSERDSKSNSQAMRRYIVAISGLVVRISSS